MTAPDTDIPLAELQALCGFSINRAWVCESCHSVNNVPRCVFCTSDHVATLEHWSNGTKGGKGMSEYPIPEDLQVLYNAAQEAIGTPAIKAFDAEEGKESNCFMHPCYDKFRELPTPRTVSNLIERIAKLTAQETEVTSLLQQRAQLTLLASNPDWTLAPDGMTAEQHAATGGAYFGSDGKIHQIGEREPEGEFWLWVLPNASSAAAGTRV